jgi:transcriptional regulator with XRE-family HTH domain
MIIAKRIAELRLARGWTQKHLAILMGKDESTIYRAEHEGLDSLTSVHEYADALGVSVPALIGLPGLPDGPGARATERGISGIRDALLATSLDEESLTPRPVELLELVVTETASALQRCDYETATRGLGDAITDLYARLRGAIRQERPQVEHLLVTALMTASTSASELNHPDLATLISERGVAVAQEAADPALLGWARRSWAKKVAGGAGRQTSQTALRICHQALEELVPRATTDGHNQVVGILHLAAMEHSAQHGDLDLSRTHELAAMEMATRLGPLTRWPYQDFFGQANVNIWRVHVRNEVHEPGQTAEIVSLTDLSSIPSASRQASFWSHVGVSLAREHATYSGAVEALTKSQRLAPAKFRLDPLARETVSTLLHKSVSGGGAARLRHLATVADIAH